MRKRSFKLFKFIFSNRRAVPVLFESSRVPYRFLSTTAIFLRRLIMNYERTTTLNKHRHFNISTFSANITFPQHHSKSPTSSLLGRYPICYAKLPPHVSDRFLGTKNLNLQSYCVSYHLMLLIDRHLQHCFDTTTTYQNKFYRRYRHQQ